MAHHTVMFVGTPRGEENEDEVWRPGWPRDCGTTKCISEERLTDLVTQLFRKKHLQTSAISRCVAK